MPKKTGFCCQFRDLVYSRIWLDGAVVTYDHAELADIQARFGIDHPITGALSIANSNNTSFTLFVTDHKFASKDFWPASDTVVWEEIA